ncbi:MAG TPA: hypothetical protein DF383_00540, partial [Deltaproteobacteria bacterium]|nr:hypothetical protein [Deltaproteobacteria bacterium]
EATQGGGLFLSDGETTIQNSTISDNKASVIAGGIFFQGEGRLQIDSSTISNNTSILAGGGLTLGFVSEVLISNSTISGNEAVGGIIEAGAPEGSLGYGGGIYRTGTGPVILVNSTVSGNTALTDGGGIFIEINSEEPLGPLDPNLNQFYNVTLAKNTATQGKGGGIAVSMTNFPQDLGASTESFAGFTNTLIADNSAGTEAPDCFGILTSQGYNLVSNIEGCTGFNQAGDQPGVPALIGPLANNGGPTQTHALQSGSTAIDRGNPEGCIDSNGAVLMRDQRNFTRPVNATGQASAICDIGAFEVGLGDSNSTLKVTKTDDVEGSVSVGDSFSYTITVTNLSSEPAMDVQLNDPLPSEVTFKGPISSSQGTCSNSGNVVNCDLGDIAANATVTIQFAVIASSPNNGVVNTVTVRALTNATTTTQTATVTTQVIEGDLQGSGCILNAANYAPGSLIGMFLPLGLGLSFIVRRRVK